SKRYAFCGNETGGLGLPFFIGLCCSYAALASRFFCPPGGAYFRFDWQKRLRVRSCFWLGIPACSEKTVCARDGAPEPTGTYSRRVFELHAGIKPLDRSSVKEQPKTP